MPTPIDTRTKLVRVAVDANLEEAVRRACDLKGFEGYLLQSSFTLSDNTKAWVILVFQLCPVEPPTASSRVAVTPTGINPT